MKYVVVKIEGKEAVMMFSPQVDLEQVKFPWPIVAAGWAFGQTIFYTCQSSLTIGGIEFGSRGLRDEILIRAAEDTDAPAPTPAPAELRVDGVPVEHTVNEGKTTIIMNTTEFKKRE